MKFTEHRVSDINIVRRIENDAIWINEQRLQGSFFMTRDTLCTDWPVTDIAQLTRTRLDTLLSHGPEVILLGTGEQPHFLPPELMAYCARHGAGVEVMRTDAACRTWNVLTTEDRPALLAIIQPAP